MIYLFSYKIEVVILLFDFSCDNFSVSDLDKLHHEENQSEPYRKDAYHLCWGHVSANQIHNKSAHNESHEVPCSKLQDEEGWVLADISHYLFDLARIENEFANCFIERIIFLVVVNIPKANEK